MATAVEPLQFKGAPGSPYTRKMLALLRYRRIPYRYHMPGAAALEAFPVPRVELLPTFYLPDAQGQLEAVTDSSPLLRRFDASLADRRVRPTEPVLALLDSVLEDFADEWLTKAMFHYRWSYAPDIAKAGDILPRVRRIGATDAQALAQARQFTQRQVERLHVVGSNAATAPTIEAGYLRLLQALDAHLQTQPFLMGQRPGASDFAFFGQLTQLTHFDPTPMALALQHAPRVYAWVDVVEDLTAHPGDAAAWMARDAVAPTLIGLLQEAARGYVPVMLANARALLAGATTLETEVDGVRWVQQTFPYQGKCLRWLREEYAALSATDKAAADRLLEQGGCSALLHAPVDAGP